MRSLCVAVFSVLSLPAFAQIVWTSPSIFNSDAVTDEGSDFDCQLATDGSGNWIAVWDAPDALNGTLSYDEDILYSRSADNGATWTPPASLAPYANTETWNDWRPQITTDGNGTWIVVWHSAYDLGGTVGNDYDVFVTRSLDNGATWSAPAALNSNAAVDTWDEDEVQIATDGAGNWMVVWGTDNEVNIYEVWFSYSSDGGVTWSARAPVNPGLDHDNFGEISPDVVADSFGNWIVAWILAEEDSSIDVVAARSTDAGQTWSTPIFLSPNGPVDGSDRTPRLAADDNGNCLVVWSSNQPGVIFVDDWDVFSSRTSDGGQTWSPPVQVNSNAYRDKEYDLYPEIATDGAGTFVVVWEGQYLAGFGSDGNNDRDILLAESYNLGATWSLPIYLNSGALSDVGQDWLPAIATDKAGQWIAVWPTNENIDGAGGDSDRDIVTARSFTPVPAADAKSLLLTALGIVCVAACLKTRHCRTKA